jgi:hypothetical protein
MAEQAKLFYEDINDAIGTTVMALGGYKKVGYMLWPNMKIESAYARLKVCVAPNGDQKLDQEEVQTLIREGRKVGCHAIMQFLCDDASYESPKPKEPEDELAQLLREFNTTGKRLENVGERITQLMNPIRAVK